MSRAGSTWRVSSCARARLSARRRADQGPLADLSSRREAHQGRAVLGRVVDPLAAGRGGAGAAAPRGDLSAAGPVSAAGQGIEPRQESRPAQARGPRDGRDVALRRQPRASGARTQGGAGRRLDQGACPAIARRPCLLVPGTAGRASAALWAGEHGRSQGDSRTLDARAARSCVRRRAERPATPSSRWRNWREWPTTARAISRLRSRRDRDRAPDRSGCRRG